METKNAGHAIKVRPNYLRQLAAEVGTARAAALIGVATSTVSEASRDDSVRLAYELAAELHYLRSRGELPAAPEAHRLLVVRVKPGTDLTALKAVLAGLHIKYMEFTDA
jgi:hypothetical protein